jgi:hypothetical protein
MHMAEMHDMGWMKTTSVHGKEGEEEARLIMHIEK